MPRGPTKFDEAMAHGGKISYHQKSPTQSGVSVYVTLPDGTLKNFSNVHPERVEAYIDKARHQEREGSPPNKDTETDQQWKTEQWMFRKKEHPDYATKDVSG
ncbi:uncharacterized protein SPPG_05980 [Spizellomyces punctatus DAOM BR117]|uniref:Uncharacterized protein n=1 Tax=Spizellomyces punctatus (strain DAOM BR117) TaxID=645134 RepID=A0A0L0HDF6_SPIPD|nr:uncharacterized protein SPPG_05980 [Spizellomyces punctatus DAOM BR117]KNC99031.1 hypothetical protein SPPG_05980 [Spizellomyces punctatus DAOM BR117]|eukprot:XP_016607071.1 hypothetical protein SPPG_05980 [Spizellomyces punctatus DAOM BR117]